MRLLLGINRSLRTSPSLTNQFRKPFVVGSIREPVARAISWFFAVWPAYGDSPDCVTTFVIKERMNEDWASAKHWFENEWKPIFGIDVYARPFPTARGWDIYENEHARALLIRVEDFDKLAEALGALYGIEPSTFHIQTTNTAATKDCAGHNEHIKKNFTLSDEELGRTYGTRHVQHFYSPDEIARYKLAFFITHARWRHADRVQVQVSTVRPDGLVVLRVAAESCRRYEPPFFEHPVKSAALGH